MVLLGDSVLDNFYWLETPEKHLRVRLQEALSSSSDANLAGLKCVNLAVDQMTTFDFNERLPKKNPWEPFSKARKKVNFEAKEDRSYMVDKDGVMRSLSNLRRQKGVQWAILSIGGNDVYLNPDVKLSLLASLLPGLSGKRQEVAKAFAGRMREVLKGIKEAAPEAKIVVVIPYQPHREFSLVVGAPINDEGQRIVGDILGDVIRSFEKTVLSDLVTPMVKEILAVAREFGCPIIDLSRTLDPDCEEHYGTGQIGKVNSLGVAWSGVEPSDVSNGFLTDLIVAALKGGPKTVVYRGLPRRDVGKWSMLVKEDKNDILLEEDYVFGGMSTRIKLTAQESNPLQWFFLGVGIMTAANLASILNGGDALFFDRSAFEAELKELEAQNASGVTTVQVEAPTSS